ncbi:MAG: hypothetical protein WBQ68_14750 [Terriglobales bacterium]
MRSCIRQFSVLGLALISMAATGQNVPAKALAPAISNLRLLASNSGYIFDGTVLSVARVAQNNANSVAMMQITFRVEQAIRGTRSGQVLTIREWAGLWNSSERYRPGERVLLFLYSPSKLGLTSPVGGPAGRFAVDYAGNALLEAGRFSALALDAVSQTELRQKNRVNARALTRAILGAGTE